MTNPSLILVPLLVNTKKIETLRAHFQAPVEIVLMRAHLDFSDSWVSRVSKEVDDRLKMISTVHGKDSGKWALVVTGPAIIDLMIFQRIYDLFGEFPLLLCYDRTRGAYKIISFKEGGLDESSVSS